MTQTLRAALDSLAFDAPGDNPTAEAAAVADKLRTAGVTGVPGTASSCPVARYLTKRTGQEIYVDPRISGYGPKSDPALWHTDDDDLPTPAAVAAFVIAFDKGAYPELRGV